MCSGGYRGKPRKGHFEFDYNTLNATRIVCLENTTPNTYANTLLQVLYLLPEIRKFALHSQCSEFHHQDQLQVVPTLLCELGFLFHMMCAVEKSSTEVPRVVTASNFQHVFQQIPEAVALGLIDKSSSSNTDGSSSSSSSTSKQDMQSLIEIFVRFLFHQLLKESELEMNYSTDKNNNKNNNKNNQYQQIEQQQQQQQSVLKNQSVVDKVLGFDICCSNHFKVDVDPDNRAQGRTRVRSLALELVYPITPLMSIKKTTPSPSSPKAIEHVSFSAALWHSLRRETTMRGWCSASESYESLRQRRCVDVRTLSSVLAVTCGDTSKGTTSDLATSLGEVGLTRLQKYWQSVSTVGGAWLPEDIEIWQLGRADVDSEIGKMVVSARLAPPEPNPNPTTQSPSPSLPVTPGTTTPTTTTTNASDKWIAFDGHTEAVLVKPAAEVMCSPKYAKLRSIGGDESGIVVRMKLFAVISQIIDVEPDSSSSNNGSGSNGSNSKHLVLHVKRKPIKKVNTNTNTTNKKNSSYTTATTTTTTADAVVEEEKEKDHVRDWILVNDLVSKVSSIHEVVSFAEWKHPCVLFYAREGYELADDPLPPLSSSQLPFSTLPNTSTSSSIIKVPASVFQLKSLSNVPSIHIPEESLPKEGSLVAFDAEFVTVEVQKVVLDSNGQRVDAEECRQILARISLLDCSHLISSSSKTTTISATTDGASVLSTTSESDTTTTTTTTIAISSSTTAGTEEATSTVSSDDNVSVKDNASYNAKNDNDNETQHDMPRVIADDCVLPSEPVVDYVTRFSGLTEEDLTPSLSRFSIISHRTAYLKLRYLIDHGCIIVGHGLKKDFETSNIFVPPNQLLRGM
eukprot:gene10277-21444_t